LGKSWKSFLALGFKEPLGRALAILSMIEEWPLTY